MFKVNDFEFIEDYQLSYRTEEQMKEGSTLYQQAKAAIAKDLNITRGQIKIIKII